MRGSPATRDTEQSPRAAAAEADTPGRGGASCLISRTRTRSFHRRSVAFYTVCKMRAGRPGLRWGGPVVGGGGALEPTVRCSLTARHGDTASLSGPSFLICRADNGPGLGHRSGLETIGSAPASSQGPRCCSAAVKSGIRPASLPSLAPKCTQGHECGSEDHGPRRLRPKPAVEQRPSSPAGLAA